MKKLCEDYRFKLEVIYAVCGVNCVHGSNATKERDAWDGARGLSVRVTELL